jgi:hypothetical protein
LCTSSLLPYAGKNEERESTKTKAVEYDHPPFISYSKGKCSIVKCIAHDKYRNHCHVGLWNAESIVMTMDCNQSWLRYLAMAFWIRLLQILTKPKNAVADCRWYLVTYKNRPGINMTAYCLSGSSCDSTFLLFKHNPKQRVFQYLSLLCAGLRIQLIPHQVGP